MSAMPMRQLDGWKFTGVRHPHQVTYWTAELVLTPDEQAILAKGGRVCVRVDECPEPIYFYVEEPANG